MHDCRDDSGVIAQRMRDEIADVEMTIGGLIAAIEAGANASTMVDRLRELETRKATLGERLADMKPIPRLDAQVVEPEGRPPTSESWLACCRPCCETAQRLLPEKTIAESALASQTEVSLANRAEIERCRCST